MEGERKCFVLEIRGGSQVKVSSRERDILLQLSEGLTDRQIADRLYLSVWTVRAHASRLRQKFEVGNRTSLVRAAEMSGII